MVRTNRRKNIEEVYGTKLEAIQPGRQPIPQPGMTKTAAMRVASARKGDSRTQRSYVTANDYYITTNTSVNATNMRKAPSGMMIRQSKTNHLPVQSKTAATQSLNYGPMSSRRMKPMGLEQPSNQQPKVSFVSGDNNKVHCHPQRLHAHAHQYGQPMPMPVPMPIQMTQRTVYMPNEAMDPSQMDFTDRERRRAHMQSHHQISHPHPLQHQLHQQQQLDHPSNTNNNAQQHSHLNMKHQQHEQPRQKQQQQQKQQLHSGHVRQVGGMQPPVVTEDEDRDEDPEEFFELIRQTVKQAVGTTISEIVNRNFRDLAGKMERFSNDLRKTNDCLGKLHAEVANKITHYGEENTRHFRYLCMKSEYDKMFYQQQQQQQTLTTGKQAASQVAQAPIVNPNLPSVPSRAPKQAIAFNNAKSGKQLTAAKMARGSQKKVAAECVKKHNPFAYRSSSKSSHHHPTEEPQSSSEQSVNVKSSELGILEVMGHIQRLCTQMQFSDVKDEQPKYTSQAGISEVNMCEKPKNNNNNSAKARADPSTADALEVESMDEIDNFENSSDEMSMYSGDGDDGSEASCDGSSTARAPQETPGVKHLMPHINQGAGDGQ